MKVFRYKIVVGRKIRILSIAIDITKHIDFRNTYDIRLVRFARAIIDPRDYSKFSKIKRLEIEQNMLIKRIEKNNSFYNFYIEKALLNVITINGFIKGYKNEIIKNTISKLADVKGKKIVVTEII